MYTPNYGLYAILLALHVSWVQSVTIKSGNVELNLEQTRNGINFVAGIDNQKQLSGTFGQGFDFVGVNCLSQPNCQIGDITLNLKSVENGWKITWETFNKNITFVDCLDFNAGVQWFGGPQRSVQVWPLQKMTISHNHPYVSRKDDNFGVAERYWLNSKGAYIYLDDRNPLFVSQNEQNTLNNGNVCFISKLENPYINRTRNIQEYSIIFRDDAKEAHLDAINRYLGKPKGHPHEGMISEPIWTTWAKYKRDINVSTILEFAESIRKNGYENGQLEIDDGWEKCYGAQEFVEGSKFSNISGVVKQLKDMNFRVTLWVHPFVNDDCQNNSKIGIKNGYFVKSIDGLTNATWWNGNQNGHQIDFTNEEAAKWWSDRLKKLQVDPQIDSFKLDAGESDYAQQPSIYPNVDQEQIPNILTASYIRHCAEFGNLTEVRSAWRTQELPIFVRMLDKDTSWEIQNGLPTLITTLFQLNMNGYTMVLPDMIGGNGYSGLYPTAELLVRWTQANTFMPAMQFSYLPWEITSTEFDAPGIVKKYVNLHKQYSGAIIKAMENSIKYGSPVNPPIWWIDPTDPIALANYDEYLVGEDILVAPVLVNGQRSRSVYLPRGTWRDGNNGTVYQGPTTLDYPAPIDVLPYFIHEKS